MENESNRHSIERRNFLKVGASAVGLVAMANPFTKAIAANCGVTPAQTAGPFYPGESRFDQNTDLTRIPGSTKTALGQVIYVRGKVLDESCQPIANANVEIWQACATGRYNNPRDPNPAPIDPNFRYWAETYTDSNGEYLFKSIIPGSYPATADWERPPHIHYKVSALGYQELTTQLYFKGHPLNERDFILQNIPVLERSSVIVDFRPSPPFFDAHSLLGEFDLTLKKVTRRV